MVASVHTTGSLLAARTAALPKAKVISAARHALSNSASHTASGIMVAAMAAALPKAVGAGWRVVDDYNAPWPVKKDTIKRESLTVAQVSFYGAMIKAGFKGLEQVSQRISVQGERNLLAKGLQKLEANQPVFLIGLMCTANFIAEAFSRKVAPRNIWTKPAASTDNKADTVAKTAVTELECALLNASEKAEPVLQAKAPKSMPLPFTSRGTIAPLANPFQFANHCAAPVPHPIFPL